MALCSGKAVVIGYIRRALLSTALPALMACTPIYDTGVAAWRETRLGDHADVSQGHALALSPNARVLIATSDSPWLPGWDQAASQAVHDAFVPRLGQIRRLQTPQALDQAIVSARAGGYHWLIYPQLRGFDDGRTEATAGYRYRTQYRETGIEQLRLHLTLVDVASGRAINAISVDAESGWVMGHADQPRRLLRTPLAQLARTWVAQSPR